MPTLRTLENRRQAILAEMTDLPPMRKGSVAAVSPARIRKDGTIVKRGPYWRYTYKDKNQKTRGRHVATRKLAETYGGQIAVFRRFRALSEELVEVSQAMADLAAEKKGASSNSLSSSRPSGAGKRRGSSSG
jgi:hypothetical protein